MRVLGLDLGTKTCGIAITDSLKIVVNGIENYEYPNNDFNILINHLKQLMAKYKNDIETIVLGYPTRVNGDKTSWTLKVESFKALLEESFPNIKVTLYDERFSTIKATEHLKYTAELKASQIKKIKDKMSAVIILQEYLDFN
jgi:putative Holliday junction resolvase